MLQIRKIHFKTNPSNESMSNWLKIQPLKPTGDPFISHYIIL